LHSLQHGQGDGQVIFFHAFAAPGFRPPVKFFAQDFVRLGVRHSIFPEDLYF
jgi:hypothetical protein